MTNEQIDEQMAGRSNGAHRTIEPTWGQRFAADVRAFRNVALAAGAFARALAAAVYAELRR